MLKKIVFFGMLVFFALLVLPHSSSANAGCCTVSGTITDSDGNGVPGITIKSVDNPAETTVTSGTYGDFTLSLTSQTAKIYFSKWFQSGENMTVYRQLSWSGNTISGLHLILDDKIAANTSPLTGTGGIAGTIFGADLTGISVSVMDGIGNEWYVDSISEHQFSIAGIPLGSNYTLDAVKGGINIPSNNIVSENTLTQKNIRFSNYINGTVSTIDSSGSTSMLSNVQVSLQQQNSNNTAQTVNTDTNGYYEFDNLILTFPAVAYQLSVVQTAPDGSSQTQFQQVTFNNIEKTVDFIFDYQNGSDRLVGETQHGSQLNVLGNVTVNVNDNKGRSFVSNSNSSTGLYTVYLHHYSDADGTYNINYDARNAITHYTYYQYIVDKLISRSVTSNIAFQNDTTEPGISITIQDELGNPYHGAAVYASLPGGLQWATTSDSNGVYVLPGLPNNSTYNIYISAPNYISQQFTLNIPQGSTKSVTLSPPILFHLSFPVSADLSSRDIRLYHRGSNTNYERSLLPVSSYTISPSADTNFSYLDITFNSGIDWGQASEYQAVFHIGDYWFIKPLTQSNIINYNLNAAALVKANISIASLSSSQIQQFNLAPYDDVSGLRIFQDAFLPSDYIPVGSYDAGITAIDGTNAYVLFKNQKIGGTNPTSFNFPSVDLSEVDLTYANPLDFTDIEEADPNSEGLKVTGSGIHKIYFSQTSFTNARIGFSDANYFVYYNKGNLNFPLNSGNQPTSWSFGTNLKAWIHPTSLSYSPGSTVNSTGQQPSTFLGISDELGNQVDSVWSSGRSPVYPTITLKDGVQSVWVTNQISQLNNYSIPLPSQVGSYSLTFSFPSGVPIASDTKSLIISSNGSHIESVMKLWNSTNNRDYNGDHMTDTNDLQYLLSLIQPI
jgi:uncharacterized protein YjbI with pentapeptide repeats